ncbi:hypothetical protein LX32DRAFT_283725 [Colletotrichum zoysiae]|uniref:Uncharacterized protein n=1 Tax=Colletotrichum zoysiae TaxID=1216348 RepID=A0AAD9HMY1_9PEZI|nr:hypothetical protein LX32DRAFT_283725 [Colletotrichum zoysiae]
MVWSGLVWSGLVWFGLLCSAMLCYAMLAPVQLVSSRGGATNLDCFFVTCWRHKKEEDEEGVVDDDDIGLGPLSARAVEDSLEAGKVPKSSLSSANQPRITPVSAETAAAAAAAAVTTTTTTTTTEGAQHDLKLSLTYPFMCH